MRASKSKGERSELQHQKEQQEHQHKQQRKHRQKQQLLRSFNSSLDSMKTNGRSPTMLPVEEQKSAAITTASTISDSHTNSQSQSQSQSKSQPQSPISSPTSSLQQPSKSRLVFGLNERTNKLKHDEYAEKRIANSGVANLDYLKSGQPSLKGSKQTLTDQSVKTNIDSNRSANVTRIQSMNENVQTKIVPNDKIREKEQSKSDNENNKARLELHQKSQQPADAKIRASKYGNFYKPQDLLPSPLSTPSSTTTTSLSQKNKSQPIVGSPPLSGGSPDLSKLDSNSKREQPPKVGQEPKRRNSTGKSPDVSSSDGQTPISKKSSSHSLSLESIEAKFVDKTPSISRSAISKSSTENNSKSLEKSSPIREKKVERNSSAKAEPSTSLSVTTEAKTKSEPPAVVAAAAAAATTTANQQAREAPPQKAPKMQFNIPPPPQVSSSSSKSSVVSYAKSRIYNKQPIKQHQHQFGQISLTGQHSLLNSGTIPESILSGFKPPKQVNVSKAREKWEGGEPFAKSKSRQRLSAQAGNKFPHGIWSITSVVAAQQMQFQQALANSSSNIGRSNINKNDLSVKILTRGSVLERVQQFEKAPGATSNSSSISPTSSTSSISSSGSDCSISDDSNDLISSGNSIGMNDVEASITIGANLSSKSEQSSNKQIILEQKQSNSKQAQYKSRVSSIQSGLNEPLTTLITSSSTTNNSPPSSPLSSLTSPPIQNKRFNLTRRRSSSLARGNSSSSIIPRFYHPNGKPNTYEIELQKKNIVACFDKFPDRNALLTSPIYKRHFHAIALACNFSEYFKEPLFLYIKHQMTQSNLLHNTSNSVAVRKTSGINLISMTNGAPNQQQQQEKSTAAVADINERSTISKSTIGIKTPTSPTPGRYSSTKNPLTRAASIDTSTMEKLQNQTYITCDQFLICWRNIINSCFDNASRFVHLLTFGQRNYLIPDDFVSLIQSIIDDHPGLKFLRAAPDFHMRYIQTVIARIYFSINKSWTGKISLNELRNSNLLAVLQVLSQEEDINQITDYFSYEHFYVIYCKFWSLDQDHDLLISKEDLARHNDASISSRIIERIFSGIVSKQIQQTGKMSYSDFVWFLIAEEDKKHPRSIEYWFRLMDIDGDGYISMYEMEYFYYEQMKRLELMNIEALPFIDSACQILDLVNPQEKNKISLSDLKRTKMATIFFDTFINLEKYLEHESREFVSTRDIVQDGVVISDWDRYASEEYESLVSEETSV